jgi:hypothetical protein
MAERLTPQVTDDWHRLYKHGWKGAIVDDAFAHPAKFARDLIRAIYDHAIEEGWLKPGDKVLDPFGGVALGALDAMRLGLNWVGMELEPKFVGLGTRNIQLWDGQFKSVIPGWGAAWLYQGDSRYLGMLLGRAKIEGHRACVTSPPYEGGGIGTRSEAWHEREASGKYPRIGASNFHDGGYGDMVEGQLGSMPGGDFDLSLSSPPFGAGETRDRMPVQDGSVSDCITRAYTQDQQGVVEGNLAHLDDGEGFEVAVASPPFQGSVGSDDPDKRGGLYRDPKRRKDVSLTGTYGETPGQLGAMQGSVGSPPYPVATEGAGINRPGHRPETMRGVLKDGTLSMGDTPGQLGGMNGEFRATDGSPPFEGQVAWQDKEFRAPHQSAEHGRDEEAASVVGRDYGQEPGQLGAMSGGLPASISSPPWERGAEGNIRKEKFRDPEAFAAQMSSGDGQGTRHGTTPESRLAQMERDQERVYGGTAGNVGNEEAETFWGAARVIVEQVYQLLTPGGVCVWVCKDFVRKGQRVPFTHQWAQLCISVGFEWLHEHRCWVVEDNGTQLGLFGEEDNKDFVKERKSFFRRLAERRGSPRIDYESVLCLRKPL